MPDETRQVILPTEGTVLKTFRIPKTVYARIQAEAKARGLTTNALVSMIFTKFVEWDRYSRRFGDITLIKEAFKSILDLAEEKEVGEIGQRLGNKIPREAYMFWFGDVSIETYLRWLENICTFAGQAEYECKVSGRDYTITLHHDLGKKWSIWLKHGHDAALKSLFKIDAQFEVSDNEVTIRFCAPPTGTRYLKAAP